MDFFFHNRIKRPFSEENKVPVNEVNEDISLLIEISSPKLHSVPFNFPPHKTPNTSVNIISCM